MQKMGLVEINLMVRPNNIGAGQTAQKRSLISAFVFHSLESIVITVEHDTYILTMFTSLCSATDSSYDFCYLWASL